jgi:ribosomal protein S18 acetylase RimI-like enzyme
VLDAPDAGEFQRLRLQALQESPAAFCSSYVQEVDTPVAELAQRLKPVADWSWVLGAFEKHGTLAGMVGFRRERGPKLAHKATLWGMYVAPQARGRGVGLHLMKELLARAGAIEGLRQVKLSVNPAQQAALRLYASLGFRAYGRESDSLFIDGRYFDEEYMVLRLPK